MVATLTADQAAGAFARRRGPANALATDADAIAHACQAMATRFDQSGRLVVFADGGSAADAAHVVVEFVHPVIVGKRALPAFALPGPDFAGQIQLLAEPADIALGVTTRAPTRPVVEGLRAARRAGLLTIGMFGEAEEASGNGAGPLSTTDVFDGALDNATESLSDRPEHCFVVRSTDPAVVKEVQVTTYHVLWELVHVFLEQAGPRR